MLRKLAVSGVASLLVFLWATRPPQVQAGLLAQVTATPMPMGSDRLSANGGTIKIVSPAAGATIKDSSVIVKVQTTNLTLGQSGTHFHLYVDGIIQGMSEGASTSIMARDLTPGEHTFEVVAANGLHREMDASDLIKVNVQSASAAAPTTAATGDNSAILVVVVLVAVVAIGGVGFVVMQRK